MKRLFLAVMAVLVGGAAHAADLFIPGTQDIPLMDGLIVNTVPNMDFDTPVGQLLAINAVGKKLTGGQVLAYYAGALPQMGWEPVSKGRYKRESDSITITVLKEAKPAIIRFETASLNAKE